MDAVRSNGEALEAFQRDRTRVSGWVSLCCFRFSLVDSRSAESLLLLVAQGSMLQRKRQLDHRRRMLRVGLNNTTNLRPKSAPATSTGVDGVSPEEQWHNQQRLREQHAALSIHTCVAPITVMLHPEVCQR